MYIDIDHKQKHVEIENLNDFCACTCLDNFLMDETKTIYNVTYSL